MYLVEMFFMTEIDIFISNLFIYKQGNVSDKGHLAHINNHTLIFLLKNSIMLRLHIISLLSV